uniref:Uncharacterized protein n=1 Tax=Rhizophora mucronata TaxID=61149 RepID=A0A2P2PBM5_RHIMU
MIITLHRSSLTKIKKIKTTTCDQPTPLI